MSNEEYDAENDAENDEFDDGPDETYAPGEGIRLQKVLAAAGLGSRRACEELIDEGRVTVDGKTVREQGMRVDPDTAIITIDGSRLPTRAGMVYLVLNKPVGVVSTMSDPEGRPCVGDYVQDRTERLFHVGRLDTDTEGLILLTNDGELANRLTHPKYGVPKIYFADIPGPIPRDLSRTLKAGVELDDGLAKADKFRMVGQSGARIQVEIEIHEGRNHIVRRMFEAVGHPVSRLVRVQIGSVNMGNLGPGRLRHLTTHEVSALLTASEDIKPPPRKKAPGEARKKAAASRKDVGAPAVRKAKAERNAASAEKKAAAKKAAPRKAAPKGAVLKGTAPRKSGSRRPEAGGDDWRDGSSSRPTKRSAPAKRSGPSDRGAPAKRSAPSDRRSGPSDRGA
ncbi:pseudouridine synthase, partial [Sporichthya sp.]|uniref:pseudouridine synthase n=1 Tax=Sporichthya sp. TaxID=65475 RepID=UPI001795837E